MLKDDRTDGKTTQFAFLRHGRFFSSGEWWVFQEIIISLCVSVPQGILSEIRGQCRRRHHFQSTLPV